MRQKSDRDARVIVAAIKQLIADEKVTVGDRLPPEVDLCKGYSASRYTVRKAMSILEKEGFVARFVGRGSFIVRPDVPSMSAKNSPTEEHEWGLHELTEARMIIEPNLIALMIERHTPADLAELEVCLNALCLSSNWSAYGEAKYAFHLALVKTARNHFLNYVFEKIVESRRKTAWSRHNSSGFLMDRVKDVCVRECRAILDALRSKDGVLMRREVENAILRVLMLISET